MELLLERLQGSAASAATLLSHAELVRAAALRDSLRRERFVLAHAFLRRSLGARLGRAPSALVFGFGPVGKPHVDGLHFSFSRSGEFAALALSTAQSVGVDIEEQRPINVQLLADHHFSAAEARALVSAEKPLDDFYRLWTRKEAVLKAYGLGVSHSLACLPAARVQDFVPATGYFGAVALV